MIKLKSPEELNIMQEGGKITEAALQAALNAAKAGVTTLELDKVAEETILRLGGQPGFKKVPDYDFTTCINVNDGLVHGIPGEYVIKPGDLVKVDVGAFYKGFFTDLSYTLEVESQVERAFLECGKEAINRGVAHFVIGKRIGAVSSAIQRTIEARGYSVSRELVGHGVGRELHEDPYVPGYGKPDEGPLIKEGMVVAIEAIYQKGKPAIKILSDNWTIATKDGSLAGLFEKTVAATKSGPIVLAGY